VLVGIPELRRPPVIAAEGAGERNVRVSGVEPPRGQCLEKLGRPPGVESEVAGLRQRGGADFEEIRRSCSLGKRASVSAGLTENGGPESRFARKEMGNEAWQGTGGRGKRQSMRISTPRWFCALGEQDTSGPGKGDSCVCQEGFPT